MSACPAIAQDTQTNCYQVGNTVQCNSRQSGPRDYILKQPAPAAPIPQAPNIVPQPIPPSVTPADDAAYSREIRKQVGEYLSKGDCETAKALALRSGEIALANEAKAYCAVRHP